MIKKAEIIVEKFDQGITIRWKDVDGIVEPQKALAPNGTEYAAIGKSVWDDVSDFICDTQTDNVRIKLEYEINQ